MKVPMLAMATTTMPVTMPVTMVSKTVMQARVHHPQPPRSPCPSLSPTQIRYR